MLFQEVQEWGGSLGRPKWRVLLPVRSVSGSRTESETVLDLNSQRVKIVEVGLTQYRRQSSPGPYIHFSVEPTLSKVRPFVVPSSLPSH